MEFLFFAACGKHSPVTTDDMASKFPLKRIGVLGDIHCEDIRLAAALQFFQRQNLDMVCSVACHQVTLVPDAPDQKTSDHGWSIRQHYDDLKEIVAQITAAGPRVSVFIDPDPDMAALAADIGAARVELYTGPYYDGSIGVDRYAATAEKAVDCGLMVNAGHDLNLDNLAAFVAAVPQCAEVSIGHAITADALNMGWPDAVKAYLKTLRQ